MYANLNPRTMGMNKYSFEEVLGAAHRNGFQGIEVPAHAFGSVEAAREHHNTSPVATAALGRLLTAGAMMGSMCKNDSDVITLQIQCSGPIGGLTVTADSKANVKGYVNNPDVMLPPKRTSRVETTLSFAMNPLIRAVQILQSSRPSGLNIGVINPDIAARMLSAEFVTMLK